MADMPPPLQPSDTESETSVYTEPSAGDPERQAFGPLRVAAGNPAVAGWRAWWLRNPLNNLWPKKPTLWRSYAAEQAGASPAEAVKSGANVKLEDLATPGPTLQELVDAGLLDVQELPSDEAWFGEPDPSVYAPGTNDLTKEQLAQEVAKGNVATLRQLREHLEGASPEELQLWMKVFQASDMRQQMVADTPSGRISMWDLLSYVAANPELAALAARDVNLAMPVQGMTREERLAALIEVAPWRLCANKRGMSLPPEAAAKLPWGLLAGGSWWRRRPSRWLKGLDGQRDFYYGLYAHEAAAQQLLGARWGGTDPRSVLADKAFYREALGLAPSLGMTVLAVASRPLPLQELTQAWEQRVKHQIDTLAAASLTYSPSNSSSSSGSGSGQQQQQQQQQQPRLLLSTSLSSSGETETESGSEEASGSGSGSSSSEAAVAAAAHRAAAVRAAAPAAPKAAAAAAVVQRAPAGFVAPAPAAAPAQPILQAQQPQSALQQPAAQQPVQQQQQPPRPAVPQQPQQQLPALQSAAAATQQPAAPTAAAAAAAAPCAVAAAPAAAAAAPAPAPLVGAQYAGLAQLVGLFEPAVLAERTALLDMRGTRLREGATIMFSAHPSGALMVQAVSPGLVKDQQSYLLGSVTDPQLTQAVMSLFLDPDHSLDGGFTAAAGRTLLAFANGYKTGDAQRAAAARRPAPCGSTLEDGKRLLRQGRWALPGVGQAPEQPPLVKGVRRAVMYQQITAAFDAALRAAAAVAVGSGEDPADASVQRRVLFERRCAAETELKRQLAALGLDASGLNLAAVTSNASAGRQLSRDLLSLARPLAG